ncbi:MAG TPA: acyltransferase [Variovorax sp.]|nr:acyltransferase [Variovorax sp.]
MNTVSNEQRRVFHALDAGRGIAALVVVLYHLPPDFRGTAFGSGYLAVDFFFALSGFVLAHAYLDRLASGRMSLREFAVARLVRLYPMYALALLVLLGTLAVMKVAGLPLPWSATALVGKLPFAAVMLPSPTLDWHAYLYPFNIAAWSILFELAVNLLFAVVSRPIRRASVRWAFIGVSGAVLIVQFQTQHVLGGGSWDSLLAGIPRVCFSFFLGLQVHEWLKHRHAAKPIHSAWGLLVLGLLLACLCVPDPDWLVLPAIFLIFPMLMLVLGSSDVPPGIAGRALRRLGVLSYAVYMLHGPILLIWTTWYSAPGALAAAPAVAAVPLLVAIVAASWAADRWFDGPVRARLGTWLRQRKARRAAAAAPS